jgi:hypothetical protein
MLFGGGSQPSFIDPHVDQHWHDHWIDAHYGDPVAFFKLRRFLRGDLFCCLGGGSKCIPISKCVPVGDELTMEELYGYQ